MEMIRSKYNLLFNILLFSGMGCFSYLFLVIYTDLPARTAIDLSSAWAFMAVVFIFNGLGLSLMQINYWLGKDYRVIIRKKQQLVVYSLLLAGLLFLLNYLLLGSVKWMIDVPHPFFIKWSGV
ncbi:MAG: histidine kinase, partial [Tannerellaceae bacterium]